MEEKINLHFHSALGGSIFEISNDLYQGLKDDFNITREWIGEEPKSKDVLLSHFVNKYIVEHESFNDFKYKILIQPIDGTSITNEFVECFNRYDLIICPAVASKNILINNGVTIPIVVIPNFYYNEIYESSETPISKYIPTDKIIFYHESTFHPRKGIRSMLEYYVKAFSDKKYYNKVHLILKDAPHDLSSVFEKEKIKEDIMNLQKSYKYKPRISKFSNFLSFQDLRYLWGRANCYLGLSNIEGFGIPILRSYLLGSAVMVFQNNNSGYHDYLDSRFSYIMPSYEIEAHNEIMRMYDDKNRWVTGKEEVVVETLRKFVDDFETMEHKRLKYTNMVSENLIRFREDNVMNLYKKEIFKLANSK